MDSLHNKKREGAKVLQLCAYCKEKANLTCAKCGEYYCSREHQTSDWGVHKKICSNNKYKKREGAKVLQLCAYCKEKANLTCAKCGEYYCSREHQTRDWGVHKKICCNNKYYKLVKEASDKPSVLVACVDIPQNTVIFQSQPIAVGPDALEPVCLGCLRPLIYDVCSYLCSDCSWPLCGFDCQHSEMHQLECTAFKNAGFQFNTDSLRIDNWRNIFMCMPGVWMLVLRVLLSGKSKDVLKYYCQQIMDRGELTNVIDFGYGVALIRNTWKLQQFEPQDIMQVAALLLDSGVKVNQLQDKFNTSRNRAGFAVHASDIILLQHSCHPNLEKRFDSKNPLSIAITARRNIRVGEKLSVAKYVNVCTQSTIQRQIVRRNLLSSQPCGCQRCSDPSELGLYLSSFLCKNCEGMTVPINTSNILETDWICKACRLVLKCDEYKTKFEGLFMELNSYQNQQDKLICLEKFIETYSGPGGTLHRNHTLILEAKRRYCEMVYHNSNKSGDAHQFDSKVLSLFRKYALDYKIFHSSLNSKRVSEEMLIQLVQCKDTINKLKKEEITTNQAMQFAIKGLEYRKLMSDGQLDICNCSSNFIQLLTYFLTLHSRLMLSLSSSSL